MTSNKLLNTLGPCTLYISNGYIIKIEKNFCDLIDYSINEIIKKQVKIIFSSQEAYSIFNSSLFKLNAFETKSFETELLGKHRTKVKVLICAIRLSMKESKNKVFALTCFDLTLLSIKTQSTTSIINNHNRDKFIAAITHDLIGLIGVSMGYIDILDSASVAKVDKDLLTKYLYKNTRNTYRLLKSLVTWSKAIIKKKAFSPEEIDITKVLNEVRKIYGVLIENKNITIDVTINTEETIIADKHMFEFIIRNLVTNAIKFSNPGGKISIQISKNRDYIVINIIDSGIGMAKEKVNALQHLKKYKDQYSFVSEKSNGYGLFLVSEYVDLHKGEIQFYSEPDRGTRVYLKLPV